MRMPVKDIGCKYGFNDVNYLFFEAIPRLKKGALLTYTISPAR
uniref:Uncharacterized protein n=1 Tax=uncultured bacterium A1Q1_fos_4 TaxID=1256574 RepID=L7VWZ1_9BACT|nr:hypothetical protein [uncultured bacterium A1Q1_fos_4]